MQSNDKNFVRKSNALECEEKASRNMFRNFFRAHFFMFVLLTLVIRFFSFNFKLICTCEFFKKQKLNSPKRLEQFQLFEKLARAN